jgi:site-specific DNA recombinase
MRVATYARVSSKEQERRETIQMQRDSFEKEIAGWSDIDQPVRHFEDVAVSGDSDFSSRSGGRRSLEVVESGLVDVLLIWKIDRISRMGAIGGFEAFKPLIKNKVRVFSIQEPWLKDIDITTPMGEMMLSQMFIVARIERENIIQRVQAGVERRALRNIYGGGRPPFGYDKSEDGKLVIHPQQTAVVKLIFDLFVNGWSPTRIADHLNSLGVLTPSLWDPEFKGVTVERWHYKRVTHILDNNCYTGVYTFGKKQAIVKDGVKKGMKEKKNGKPIQFRIPEIVGRDVFEQARSLRDEMKNHSMPKDSDFLLSGILYCGVCDAPMYGMNAKSKGKHYRYYCCSARTRKQACKMKPVRCQQIDLYIIWILQKMLMQPGLVKVEVSLEKGSPSSPVVAPVEQQIAALQTRLDQIDIERDRLIQKVVKGLISDKKSDQLLGEMKIEETRLLKNIERLQIEISRLSEPRDPELSSLVQELVIHGKDIPPHAYLELFSVDQLRELAKMVWNAVAIFPFNKDTESRGIGFDWRYPVEWYGLARDDLRFQAADDYQMIT